MPTKILHISDLHIGRCEGESGNFNLIKDRIIEKGKKEWKGNKPIIMITGDIVNDGEKAQYIRAKGYLDKLHGAGFTLRLIPGNHDYGKKGNLALKEGFERFEEYFKDYHELSYPLLEEGKDVGKDNNHFFVGLNSMQAEYDGLDAILADGELGEEQITKTVDFLKKHKERKKSKMIVYLHHHPFLYPDDFPLRRVGESVGHWLKDGKKFMTAIRDLRVDVLLFGHEHRHLNFTKTILNKKFNIPYILSSGKSTELSRSFRVLFDGRANEPRYEYKSFADSMDQYDYDDSERERVNEELERIPQELYGRLVEIDDDGKITVENEIFEKKSG